MKKMLLSLCILALLAPAPANADEPKVLRGHHETIRSVAFSKDGRYLLSQGFTTALWDVQSGELLLTTPRSHCAMFTPDQKYLAVGMPTRDIEFYELQTRKKVPQKTVFIGNPGFSSMQFHPAGELVAVVLQNKTILIRHMAKVKDVTVLKNHTDWIHTLAFTPGGKYLATGGEDHQLILWDCATWKPRYARYLPGDKICSLALSTDGKLLATGVQTVRVNFWETATGQAREKYISRTMGALGNDFGIAFSPDAKTLAVASSGYCNCVFWDVRSEKPKAAIVLDALNILPWEDALDQVRKLPSQRMLPVRYHFYSVAYSPDGRYLAFGACQINADRTGERVIVLWKLTSD
jgi:WD40 repeat protein